MKKYHGATMVYHSKQWYTMVHCKRTVVNPCVTMVQAWHTKMVHPFVTIWNNLLVQWDVMVYHRTSLYHHGTNILYHGILQCTMVQPCATTVHPWYK